MFYEPDVFDNNPRICKTPKAGEKVVRIENGPGKRPYIAGGDSKRWYWNTDFKAEPGEIYLLPHELAGGEQSKGKILIEPYVKDTSYSQNKEWPHWKEFVRLAKKTEIGDKLIQFDYESKEKLVQGVKTKKFRSALINLANVDMVITVDGALHHAAAAMNIPCVTLWGGLINPLILGYENQVNIWHDVESCGSKGKCSHCHEAMRNITPEEVLNAALALRRAQVDQATQNALNG